MKMGAQLISIGDLSVGVWLHAESDPPADEWSASCRNVAEFAGGAADLEQFRALIVTDGGTPDARQRKELFQDALRGYPAKISVITEAVANSPLKRGIATALTWMNPNFRVFGPGELMLASRAHRPRSHAIRSHLGVPRFDSARARAQRNVAAHRRAQSHAAVDTGSPWDERAPAVFGGSSSRTGRKAFGIRREREGEREPADCGRRCGSADRGRGQPDGSHSQSVSGRARVAASALRSARLD